MDNKKIRNYTIDQQDTDLLNQDYDEAASMEAFEQGIEIPPEAPPKNQKISRRKSKQQNPPQEKPAYTPPPENHPAPAQGQPYSPVNKKSSMMPLVIVIVLVLVLIAGGIFAVRLLSQKDDLTKNESVASNNSNSAAATAPENNTEVAEETQPGTAAAGMNYQLAITYLPAPNKVRYFLESYPDGVTENVLYSSGLIEKNGPIVVTEVSALENSQPGFAGLTMHYFEKQDGIHLMYDHFLGDSTLWLPNDLAPGKTWTNTSEYGDVIFTVLSMDETITYDFATFQHCLVVEEINKPVDMTFIHYYAPGFGEIRQKTGINGSVTLELKDVYDLSEAEINQTLKENMQDYTRLKKFVEVEKSIP